MERELFAPRELPPLPPDVAQDPQPYSEWVVRREAQRTRGRRPATRTALGLLMLAGDAPAAAVASSLRSLRVQTTHRWTLTLAAPAPRRDDLAALVRSVLGWRARRRVDWLLATPETALPDLLVQGLRAQPNATALVFPGDVWAPDAVARLAAAVTPTGVVYADEDTRRDDGSHDLPRLKPDYSPDFLLSSAYVGRPLAIGSTLLRDVPELAATDLATLEHECALDVCAARLVGGPPPRGPLPSQPPSGRNRARERTSSARCGADKTGPRSSPAEPRAPGMSGVP